MTRRAQPQAEVGVAEGRAQALGPPVGEPGAQDVEGPGDEVCVVPPTVALGEPELGHVAEPELVSRIDARGLGKGGPGRQQPTQ